MNISQLAITSSHLNVMLKAVMAAATDLVRDFGELENLQVSTKGTGGFVTKSDMRAEKTLHYHLSKARPGYSFLMEESGSIPGEDPDYCWIVDPLDGTTNFMHGYPHFAISVALEYKGKIVCALVYDPIKDELFYGEKGRGCFYNHRRIRVAARSDLTQTLVGVRFPKNVDQELNRWFIEANKQVASIRKSGSSVLDLCYVAAGRLDAFVGSDLSSWDIAAGTLFVREAGGFAFTFAGEKASHTDKTFIAGNERQTQGLLKLLG